MQELELLCPAKDLESGKLAINYGADAVYIGAGKFGARASAGNPVSDIEELCRSAHQFRAKVYVTLNTILYDHEIAEAHSLIWELYHAGADSLIIQDMGILELDLPPIPLFASTQTHNYDLKKIKFLEDVGISRIILARELSIAEIKKIKSQTHLGLEAFIHGALCVSFSGQCYFSHATTGRSANRGECAQACRMPFDLIDGDGKTILKNRHLLSLKDFQASKHLADLIEAGITSFKIEGRLKDKNYIINNTAYYRQLLDSYLLGSSSYCKASSGKTHFSFAPDPDKSFNRGFTDYFLGQRKPEMASFETPKSKGKLIGKVKKTGKDFFMLDTDLEINNGDGLCFIDKNGGLEGFNVNRFENGKIYPSTMRELSIGINIYRNFDRKFSKELEANRDKRKIKVRFIFSETREGFLIKAIDEDGHELSHSDFCEQIPANKPDRARETIITQLKKAGDTNFEISEVEIDLSKDYFIPASFLNNLRRSILVLLEEKRRQNYKREERIVQSNEVPYPEDKIDHKTNVSNDLAKKFYARHGVQNLEEAFELLPKTEFAGKTIMTTRYCIKFELGVCPHKQDASTQSLHLKEPLFLHDKQHSYRLEFDCKACLMKVVY
ncbi:MAG: U32 family peptidase [Bacteroidales bacterium]|nr:U32 family peptidase [Bacteroidales bacterium]MCF8456511.1 U32 family peptidase [Bacteroidales bacterium]